MGVAAKKNLTYADIPDTDHKRGHYTWEWAQDKTPYTALNMSEDSLSGNVHKREYKWQAFRVHRLAYILHVRAEIPENMHYSHRCHNSLGVNVEHLTLEPAFVSSSVMFR